MARSRKHLQKLTPPRLVKTFMPYM